MADPLPQLPPIPDLDDSQFANKMAVRQSIQALYRDAAVQAQTAALIAAQQASDRVFSALMAEHQNVAGQKRQMFEALVRTQFETDRDGTIRTLAGTHNINLWAQGCVDRAFELYPDPATS